MMRSILYDWMMELSNAFMLKRETYQLAINYVDRFLTFSGNIVSKQEF